ncbi:MAG: 16S rRNA (cytidine(1402)-2'-O)-methyltransferase [Gammaproteobacteria bacterium]|nr:16S rRNA (cytidine(1402)-2'-O)-methyltransferase [Gammaproteobacteria bacterium]
MKETKTGCLFVVATPIGNLEDLSPRAQQVLDHVDLIAAEDTRHSGRLLAHFNIDASLISLHEHNETERTSGLLKRLHAGDNIALICDAGTPLISDPGFRLLQEARRAGLAVSPIPGPCAALAALSVAGLPTDRFVFEGFLPAKTAARMQRLQGLAQEQRTLVFYVPVHQLARQLGNMVEVFGEHRVATLARELTKLHETISHGTLGDLQELWQRNPSQHKGELVLVVGGAQEAETTVDELQQLVSILLENMGPKQAAQSAVRISGCARNRAYKIALELAGMR